MIEKQFKDSLFLKKAKLARFRLEQEKIKREEYLHKVLEVKEKFDRDVLSKRNFRSNNNI